MKVTLLLDDGLVSRAAASDGRRVNYRYGSGRLASVARGDDRTEYRYAAGRLTSIDDGVKRTFSYDGSGRVVAASDLDGGHWTISPPAPATGASATGTLGREFEVESPEGWTRTYRFTQGSLVEVVDDDLGVMLRRDIVDGQVKVEERPLEGMRSERLAADHLQVVQEQGGGPSRTVDYWFDDAGRVVRTETAEGESRVRYDGGSGRPSEVRGPDGTQTFEYDAFGLLLATEDADGYRVEVERNELGQPLVIADGVQRTEFAYDAAGQVNQQHTGDTVTSASYRPDGLLDSLTSSEGDKLTASYDDRGRLQALGDDEAEPASEPEPVSPDNAEPSDEIVETVERSDGRYEQQYPSGETVVLDEAGRPAEVTVDGRTESRRYDEAGRVTELELPGGPTYQLTYTKAGRVESVSDGTVAADLSWHGDLLVSLETSGGSSYEYDYDEAGRMITATSGPLRWDYTYDEAGRSSVVRGPAGVVRSRWDEQGRPLDVRDGGHVERYGWAGDGLDLAKVDIDGEETLSFERDNAGRVIEVTEADSGSAELSYDPDTGVLNRYEAEDSDELTLGYDSEGQVVSLKTDDRTEAWTWSNGEVVQVDVDGEDDPYRLDWLAPGLLGDVQQGDDHLLRTEVDDAGRPTKMWGDDDLAGLLSWTDAGLVEASMEDGPSAKLDRDDEHRTVTVEVGDQIVDWSYEAGALTTIEDGDQTTNFVYSDGRLDRTIHDDDGTESTITWDPSKARPQRITTQEGEVAFAYEEAKVAFIEVDGMNRQVRYEDDQPAAKGDAGEIVDALFNDTGQYRSARGQSTLGPTAPWVGSLPEEFGIALPEVVTGRHVAESAIDNQLPNIPGFLVADTENLADRTALSLVAATAGQSVAVGPDQVAALGLGAEGDLTLDFGGAVDIATAEQATRILTPEPGVLERVVDFGQDVAGAVVSGIGDGFRAVQRYVTQTSVADFISTISFMAANYYLVPICAAAGAAVGASVAGPLGLAVGSAVAGAGCAATIRIGEALLIANGGQGIVPTIVAAAIRPLGDLVQAINSGDLVAIVLSSADVAGRRIGKLRPQARSAVCGLRRMVCVSSAQYGAAAQHAAEAQRNGSPRLLRLDRTGAATRRSSALRNLPARAGFDRDEYPFAVSSRRNALSIQYIDPSSNRSLGAYVGGQLRALPDGAWFYVLPVA